MGGVFRVTNKGVKNMPKWAASAGAKVVAGDFNGDGKADIAVIGPKGWGTFPIAYAKTASKMSTIATGSTMKKKTVMRVKKTAKAAEHQAPSKLAAKVHKLLGKTAKAAKTTKPANKPRTIHDLIGATAKTAQMSKKSLLKKKPMS